MSFSQPVSTSLLIYPVVEQEISAGTYTIIDGVPDMKIRIIYLSCETTQGTLTLIDSQDNIIIDSVNNAASSGYRALPEGASLKIIVSQDSIVNIYITAIII